MGKFRELQPPISLDDGLTMVFKRLLQLEENVKNLTNRFNESPTPNQGPRGQLGVKGAKGPPGEKGQLGEKGEIGPVGYVGKHGKIGPTGEKGDRGEPGVTTIKHIYMELPKEIEEKLGSLGSVASASDAEKRANKLLDDIEFMKSEIHTMYKEKYQELKKAQEPPKKKSVFKRLFRRD